MDIRFDGKRALVTGAGKGKFTSFLRLQRPKSTCKPKQEMITLPSANWDPFYVTMSFLTECTGPSGFYIYHLHCLLSIFGDAGHV